MCVKTYVAVLEIMPNVARNSLHVRPGYDENLLKNKKAYSLSNAVFIIGKLRHLRTYIKR